MSVRLHSAFFLISSVPQRRRILIQIYTYKPLAKVAYFGWPAILNNITAYFFLFKISL